jgi:hypothetical protein
MAQKIELGLYLEGDDARRFEEVHGGPRPVRHPGRAGDDHGRVRAHGEELVKSIR